MAVVSLVWLIRQVVRFSRGGLIDLPKYPAFRRGCAANVGWLCSPRFRTVADGGFDDASDAAPWQYHRLVWFHIEVFIANCDQNSPRFGSDLNRRLITYAAVVLDIRWCSTFPPWRDSRFWRIEQS